MILIEHIDEIGRRLQRDVLFLEFHPRDEEAIRSYQYQHDPNRIHITRWLDQHGIPWQMCGSLKRAHTIESYRGQIFLDVPFDLASPEYLQLLNFLENPDGSCSHHGVRFYALALSVAMENDVAQNDVIDQFF